MFTPQLRSSSKSFACTVCTESSRKTRIRANARWSKLLLQLQQSIAACALSLKIDYRIRNRCKNLQMHAFPVLSCAPAASANELHYTRDILCRGHVSTVNFHCATDLVLLLDRADVSLPCSHCEPQDMPAMVANRQEVPCSIELPTWKAK